MGRVSESKYMVQAGWDDVPHLDDKTKRELLAETPPFLREARSKGAPSLGAGAVYPYTDDEVCCPPFAIPDYWPRAYGMDVGWNRTAAIWGARDPADGVIYLYAEHYLGQQQPAVHAQAIQTRGKWIKGAIDPAARGRGQKDGEQLLQNYRDLGLKVIPANNAVESGIYRIWSLYGAGRLKVFATLTRTLAERRLYRRNEKGVIVKENDHLMDAKRYLLSRFDDIAAVRPIEVDGGPGWSPKDPVAGY